MDELQVMKNASANPDDYGYATGLIRAMETKLLSHQDLARVFDARQVDDILQIMQDAGYEIGDAEQSLHKEAHSIYELLRQIMPDRGFSDALLLFNDCHNLKVVLKYLSVWWVKLKPDDSKSIRIPESAGDLAFQGMEKMIRLPSIVEPAKLFSSIRDRSPDLIPEWLYNLALKASELFLQTYDTGRMDMLIDKTAWEQAMNIAKNLNNDFFTGYLQLRADLINFEILFRCRSLKTGKDYMLQALLNQSSMPVVQFVSAYEMDNDELKIWLKNNPIMDKISEEIIAELAEGYGKTGVAARYNRLADEKIMDWLDKAKMVLRGPEIPLSYLLKRELEIKNLRIALTCLRNGIAPAHARELARGNF